jgi:hypothetical protein
VLGDADIARLLSREDLERVFVPEGYLGATDAFIDAALADHAGLRAKLGVA